MKYNTLLGCLQNLINEKPTQAELSRILGMSSTAINNRRKRNSNFSEEEIQKINNYYNVDILTANALDDDLFECNYYPDIFGNSENGKFVPAQKKEVVRVPALCFILPPEKGREYSIINMQSDCMAPTITQGDRIIIKHIVFNEWITDNNIYAFVYENKLLVRRLLYNFNEVIMKCDNPEFSTKYIPSEKMKDFLIIGQVIGCLMRNLGIKNDL